MKLMTIEQLDKWRVLISLKPQDMDTYAISIDKLNVKDNASKEALKTLLKLACDKVGIDTAQKAVLVEAMPHKEGLFILVTVDFKGKLRKTYKVKKPKMLPCCKFSDAEGLFSCVEHLNAEGIRLLPNSLWLYKEAYYLLFDFSGITSKAKAILSEYALCLSVSHTRLARIKEVGKELLKSNAVEKIAEAMCGQA